MSTDLIKRLRDALYAMQQSALQYKCGLKICDDAIAEADAHLKNGGWVRVEDALPVVPEGDARVAIWIAGTKPTTLNRVIWMRGDVLHQRYTSWRYAEPTPQPPEQTK